MKQKIYGAMVEVVHQPKIVPACMTAGERVAKGTPFDNIAQPVRTPHTLDMYTEKIMYESDYERRYLERQPQSCPGGLSVHGKPAIIGSDDCNHCPMRGPRADVLPTDTVECLVYDCRDARRHIGDSRRHRGLLCVDATTRQLMLMSKCRNKLIIKKNIK